ncbi:MAG: Holliday junction resolvase RuvX [Holosporaceae bacterium]|nr:Holliday junction resolvase RuvX [Holosporaceae bacterium]
MNFIPLETIKINELNRRESVFMGLDVGSKTIGMAVSDRRNKIASSVGTIARKGNNGDFFGILRHLKSYNVGLIICGWPLQMDGLACKQCEKVENFIEKLSKHTDVGIARWDERFSTSVVDKIMIEADLSRKRRKQLVDKTAAVYILQGALDFLNHRIILLEEGICKNGKM